MGVETVLLSFSCQTFECRLFNPYVILFSHNFFSFFFFYFFSFLWSFLERAPAFFSFPSSSCVTKPPPLPRLCCMHKIHSSFLDSVLPSAFVSKNEKRSAVGQQEMAVRNGQEEIGSSCHCLSSLSAAMSLEKISFNPSESVTYMPDSKRQNAIVTITNNGNSTIMYKWKSTRPGVYKMRPTAGWWPATRSTST